MEYIKEVLGVKVIRKQWKDERKLPYFLTDKYIFEHVTLDECNCIFVIPKGTLDTVNTIKKHIIAINKVCDYNIVIELDKITRQKRKSFIESKIPFVVTDKQLYLPFMGAYLREKFDGEKPKESLLPSAQMLLFMFIYGKCEPLYLSKAVERLHLTPMSVSRSANQLIELNLLSAKMHNRSKILYCETTAKELFKKAKCYFTNPVRKTVYIDKHQVSDKMFMSGLSALSKQTMLNLPQTETYGTNEAVKEFNYSSVLIDTDKQCTLEFWKYDGALLSQNNQADILSLAVIFDKSGDERTQMEIHRLLEKVWE